MDDPHLITDGFTIGVSSQSMKGERIRYQQTGEFHFLTFSCYRRRPYPSTVEAIEPFEDALERIRRRYFFAVAGYVVMPPPRSPKARDRVHPLQRRIPLEIGFVRRLILD